MPQLNYVIHCVEHYNTAYSYSLYKRRQIDNIYIYLNAKLQYVNTDFRFLFLIFWWSKCLATGKFPLICASIKNLRVRFTQEILNQLCPLLMLRNIKKKQ
jgi:hypothetical protein